jgi:2'-5' RNA ligase
VGGIGCFPNSRRPRVVWAGIADPAGRLTCLQSAVEEALGSIGFTPEARRFTPHLTLGRINRRTSRQDAALVGHIVAGSSPAELGAVTVVNFNLIRSVLRPTGAEYTTLAKFTLQDA